ncbi:K02A2.6-like [Cordylochernes scorpioides]|uniref:K02A2.6-like n=1 Tax=Cordylochernes scorpioides TaxID=51811 RepID=A0ABY6LBR8_9ARAC|nr:K02A2.6-like [Cordylochernes scorpioides]
MCLYLKIVANASDVIFNISRKRSFVRYSLHVGSVLQFCVHADKRKMLQELTSSLYLRPNKGHVLEELAATIASAVSADHWTLFLYDKVTQMLGSVTELRRSRRLQGREPILQPLPQRIEMEDDHRPTVSGSYLPCQRQRDPSTFSGDGNINPGQWLKEYERVSKYNRWDETMKLANVVFYLNGTAGRWFDNNEESLNSWRSFEDAFRGVQAQKAEESSESYIQEILSLCHQVNPRMEEGELVAHIIKGISEDTYQVLVAKDIQTVDEILKFCRHLTTVKQRRIGRTKFARLSNVMPISCVDDSDDLAGLIRRIVREEIQKVFSAPEVVNPLREVNTLEQTVREEVSRALQPTRPQVNVVQQQPRTPYYNIDRPTQPRKTEHWRTYDDKPICFHCGRPGHVVRYCRERRQVFAEARSRNGGEGRNVGFSSRPPRYDADDDYPFSHASECEKLSGAASNGGEVAIEENPPGYIAAKLKENFVMVEINGRKIKALVDSGADFSVISDKFRRELKTPLFKEPGPILKAANKNLIETIGKCVLNIEVNGADFSVISDKFRRELKTPLFKEPGPILKAANKNLIETIGKCVLNIEVNGLKISFEFVVLVECSHDIIFGWDFFKATEAVIDCGRNELHLGETSVLESREEENQRLFASDDFVISPKSIKKISVINEEVCGVRDVLVSTSKDLLLRKEVLIPNSLVTFRHGRGSIWVANGASWPQLIPSGMNMCTMESYENGNICSLIESSDKLQETQLKSREWSQKINLTLDPGLSEIQRLQLVSCLDEFIDIFDFGSTPIKPTSTVKHKINTGDQSPIKQRPYRVAPSERRLIQDEVNKMIENHIVKPSESPWSSPVILVRKKDGTWRFCVDYRRLNKITKKDVYPLPRIDDALDSLAGSSYFSTMDLRSGYWQIEVDEKDREKTAFITPDGLYEFQVMPFGLCNAPATFERMIDSVLGSLKWNMCLCYLDDIVVYAPTFEEHLRRLQLVLSCIQKAGLSLNHKKCLFGSRRIKILGHLVDANGIHPDPDKVEAVSKFPRPRNISELKSFLGLCSYYRRFIENFADKARSLHDLLKTEKQFYWDAAQEKAFEVLKTALISEPVLGHFDESTDTHLHTDASGHGIGAVLLQIQGGKERPIAYASRSLTKAENNYSTTEKECLAVVWSISKFRPYLFGRPFPVVTDHHSLCWLVGVDLLGRFPVSKDGNRWIIVCTDYMTRYAITKAIPDGGAIETAKFLVEDVILKHGAPREMITDRGRNFISQVIKEINALCGIVHRFTTAYHPQTNGLTERFNKTLGDMLSMYTGVEQKDWDQVLPYVTFAYNTAKQEATGYTPFFLVHAREAETYIDAVLPYLPDEISNDYVGELVTRAEEARQLSRSRLLQSQAKDRRLYDQKHTPVYYQKDDLVWVFTPIRKVGLSEKLLKRYFGPYKVTKKLSEVTYEVEPVDLSPRSRKSKDIVHVIRMKPYLDPEEQHSILLGNTGRDRFPSRTRAETS